MQIKSTAHISTSMNSDHAVSLFVTSMLICRTRASASDPCCCPRSSRTPGSFPSPTPSPRAAARWARCLPATPPPAGTRPARRRSSPRSWTRYTSPRKAGTCSPPCTCRSPSPTATRPRWSRTSTSGGQGTSIPPTKIWRTSVSARRPPRIYTCANLLNSCNLIN